MIKQAVIVSVSEDKKTATVSPLLTGHCLSCKEGCAKRGSPFPVANVKNLEIAAGKQVIISSSKKIEALQSILSLFFPVITAVLMYRLSFPLSRLFFSAEPQEGFKAVCVLCGILVSSGIVLAISHFRIIPAKPEITEVI